MERKIEGEGRGRRGEGEEGGGSERGREGDCADDKPKYENEILIIECVM